MESRILCVVTSDELTRPGAPHLENNRVYHYPDPGTVIHAKAEGEVVRMVTSAAQPGPLLETFRWLPGTNVDIGFGMVIIDDFVIKQEKPQALPLDSTPFEWEFEHHGGEERAKDLARMWRQYGCVQMSGENPTSEEIEKAKELRREYGLNRLNQVIDLQNKRRGGMKGIKPNFDRSDRAWAKEFGVALVDTVELLPRHPDTAQAASADSTPRIACPQCGEQISQTAKICHFCRSKFGGLTVKEQVEMPAEQEVTT